MSERTDDQMNESADLIYHLRSGAELLARGCGWGRTIIAMMRAADLIEADFFQHFKPVPVSERPWKREGWCNKSGQCWMGDPGGGGFIPSWRLCCPEDAQNMRVSLPFHALPLPAGGGAAMTDPSRPPLWLEMRTAYDCSTAPNGSTGDWTERDGFAAEIRAVRDWLTPEAAEPLQPCPGSSWGRWHERQRLRAILTAEANRTEKGDDD